MGILWGCFISCILRNFYEDFMKEERNPYAFLPFKEEKHTD